MSNKLQHLALIMDGNRRWARKRDYSKFKGHTEGAKNIEKVAKLVLQKNIPYLTLFALSVENVKQREQRELDHLFKLTGKLINHLDKFLSNDVKLNLIGDLSVVPEQARKDLKKIQNKTEDNESLVLTLAINYGGRDEIVRATKDIIKAGIKTEELDEDKFSDFLDTAGMPEVDLLIRTGERNRISNFLIWQAAYSEFFFTDTLWPAFDEEDLDQAIKFFNSCQRNFGA